MRWQVQPTKHALGVFLDNPGQTYFNLGAGNEPSPDTAFMGALYGELNVFFIYGGSGACSTLHAVLGLDTLIPTSHPAL